MQVLPHEIYTKFIIRVPLSYNLRRDKVHNSHDVKKLMFYNIQVCAQIRVAVQNIAYYRECKRHWKDTDCTRTFSKGDRCEKLSSLFTDKFIVGMSEGSTSAM